LFSLREMVASGKSRPMLYVQYGAGFSNAPGWISYDSSPTLRIQKVPIAGRSLARRTGIAELFPEGVTYGDVLKGLPVADESVAGLYASHVLEHLSLDDMRRALAESLRVLQPGGTFRLVVPDLKERARRYVESDASDAAHAFMRATYLGHEARSRTIMGRLRALIGNSMHLWMYDYPAMAAELDRAGFIGIRRAELGDAADPMFARLEDPHAFENDGIAEVAIECRKPGAETSLDRQPIRQPTPSQNTGIPFVPPPTTTS